MGNLCNGTSSVGVIETTPHPQNIGPQNVSKEEEIIEENNQENEVNNERFRDI